MDNPDWYCYKAQCFYQGNRPGEASMEAGDLILVSSQMLRDQDTDTEDLNYYIYGQNQHSREEGFFPGDLSLLDFFSC